MAKSVLPGLFFWLVLVASFSFYSLVLALAVPAVFSFDLTASYTSGLATTLDEPLGEIDDYNFSQSHFHLSGPILNFAPPPVIPVPSVVPAPVGIHLSSSLDLLLSQRTYATLSDRTNHYWQLQNSYDLPFLDDPARYASLSWDWHYQDRAYADITDNYRRWGGGVGGLYRKLLTGKTTSQINLDLTAQSWLYPQNGSQNQDEYSEKVSLRQRLFWDELMADGFLRLNQINRPSNSRNYAQGKLGLTYNPDSGFLDILRLGYKKGWAQTLEEDETDLNYDYTFQTLTASAGLKLWPKFSASLKYELNDRLYDQARYTANGYNTSLSLKYEPVYHKNYYTLTPGWSQMTYLNTPTLTRNVPSLELTAIFAFDPDWRLELDGCWAQYNFPDDPAQNCRTYRAAVQVSKGIVINDSKDSLDLGLGYSFTYKDYLPNPSHRLHRVSAQLSYSF